MADSAVPITAGAGTNVDTRTQTGGDHRQVMVVGDPTNADVATVFGAGYQRVMHEAHQVFYDPFDAALDTTNLWTSANAGGGVAPAVASGSLTLGSGTTPAGYSRVISIPTFKPTVPAWLGYSFALSLPDGAAVITNAVRFWGAGTTPASPTVAAPLTDAIGFMVDTDGKMYAVVYAAGTRTTIQDLSAATGNSKQPTDASSHRYGVYYRTDRSYFFIDTLDNVVATTAFQAPAIQTLPVLLLDVAGTTPASSASISCTGLAVWDTAGNSVQLSDGAFPWRKVTVKPASTAAVATDLPQVVALHPTSPLPTGTNTIGSVTGSGAAGTPATGVLTVQGITSGTPQPVKHITSGTGNITSVAGTVTANTTVLAANTARLGALVFNDSTAIMWLSLGATCGPTLTPTTFTVSIAAGGYWELPTTGTIYTGIITGTWSAAVGSARVTELV